MRKTTKKLARKPVKPKSSKPAEAPVGLRLEAAVLNRSLGYSLRRAQLSTYQQFSACMEALDIRPSQFAVLALIRANPGSKQTVISSALGIQKTNFVSLLDKLEARGLTERRRAGGDRRSSALYLTEEGEAFVAKMEAAHDALEKTLTGRLGARRTRELLDMLHRFSHAAPPDVL